MNTTKHDSSSTATCEFRSGHWVSYRARLPVAYDADTVLDKSDTSLPGNLRYALADESLWLVGELRDCFREFTFDDVCQRLSQIPPAELTAPCQSDLATEAASLLLETLHPWTAPESATPPSDQQNSNAGPGHDGSPDEHSRHWACAVNDARVGNIELTATIVSDGVEVQASLGDISQSVRQSQEHPCREAIALLLARTHLHLRFARFAIRDNAVVVVSFASADRLDVELPDSVAATIAGVRLVRPEVQALADPAVANAYLAAVVSCDAK